MSSAVRVLYIAGSGRSGSTVLDAILGNLESVESVGELEHLPDAVRSPDRPCACGAPGATCPYWRAVLARFAETGGELEALGRRSARGPASWLALATGWTTAANDAWLRNTRLLLRALAEETGARVLVDSSKSPDRAAALAELPGVDLFLLHLVRDVRGVAWSLAKSFEKDVRNGVQGAVAPRSPLRSALFWRAVNAGVTRLRRRLPPDRSAVIRYEDYVQDLGRALAPLAEFLGTDPGPLAAAIHGGADIPVGHAIAGNRLRMQSAVELRADTEWRERMPPRAQRAAWAAAAGPMKAFGYAR